MPKPLRAFATPVGSVSGMKMKIHVLVICLFLSSPVFAIDPNVVIGQWANYQSNLLASNRYYFLNINPDFSGVIVRYFGDAPFVNEFNSSDLIKHDGYFEINLTSREKAVFSAWKLKSGAGRLTGQLFMYEESGDLFNMLYFPLDLLTKNHKLLKYDEIRSLSARYR